MLFDSLEFLVFFPLVMAAYFTTRGTARLVVCLVASYVFYGWWDWRFLSLIAFSTGIDFVLGLWLDGESSPRKRWWLLLTSIVVNLGVLGVFKYCNFFVDSLEAALHGLGWAGEFRHFHIVLPVGISFYTFQTMSYSIDIYRGQLPAERSLLRFAVFVAFFPQLVAGPIVRASDFLPQLRKDHPFDWDRALSGALLVLWGFFLKIVIADSLAGPVEQRFAEPAWHSSSSLLIGVVFYAFQIYADFAGYSCIAIGLARILGFDFGRNFHRPYFAASFSEFWQRWHISLSSWLRDYLYIPLGGNRHGSFATYRNLMLTMLLGGLWHGASWQFVIWGGLHGSYLIAQRLLSKPWERCYSALRLPRFIITPVLIGLVFVLTSMAWVFFRAESLADAVFILSRIASFQDFTLASVTGKFLVAKGFLLIGILLAVELISSRWSISSFLVQRPAWASLATAGLLWMLALLGTYSQNNFIYFQF